MAAWILRWTCMFVLWLTLLTEFGVAQHCRKDCHPPKCSCARYSYPMDRKDIPQMVYFAFDDAVNVMVSTLYDRLFTDDRTNPNGCPIRMSLFISHRYTDYRRVKQYYELGHEIAVHSVTHTPENDIKSLHSEASKQKQNLERYAGIPSNKIKGWRSPFLKPASPEQPKVLKELGFEYDITYTYPRHHTWSLKPWPFTADQSWPFSCSVPPCPNSRVEDFWLVPVASMMDYQGKYPCTYVDGCAIKGENEDEAFKFLMDNFLSYYNTTRTPFGLNMHAAWFYTRHNLKAMIRFLDELAKMDDVYVVTVSQLLDWMRKPTTLADIHTLNSWNCRHEDNNVSTTVTTTTPTTTTERVSDKKSPLWFILSRLF